MEETAEHENIYNLQQPTVTNILPNCHTHSRKGEETRQNCTFPVRRQTPKRRSFHWETPHLPATNAPIMIKHMHAKSAESRLTISIQSSARRLSSHYLLSSSSKAIFVSEYPLISIKGHTQSRHMKASVLWRALKLHGGVPPSDFPQNVSRSYFNDMSCRVKHLS